MIHSQDRISQRNKNEILNSKNEFNHPPIAKITVEGKRRRKKIQKCASSSSAKIVNITISQILVHYLFLVQKIKSNASEKVIFTRKPQ